MDTINVDVIDELGGDVPPLASPTNNMRSALNTKSELNQNWNTDKICKVSCKKMNKKQKFLQVCGDRAVGYNFGIVSCESCKAFFRRNASREHVRIHKTRNKQKFFRKLLVLSQILVKLTKFPENTVNAADYKNA